MGRLLETRSVWGKALTAVSIFALLGCLTLPALAAGGQFGGLRGTLADAASKSPIAGALVTAVSANGTYTATTDARGNFSIIGMVVDTYSVTIVATGYATLSLPGQTLTGDQTLDIGRQLMARPLKEIAHVSARSAGGAFQPSTTIDSYTITPAQQIQTTGKAFSTNENDLLLAVPGVTLTNDGMPTIRGGAAYEVGYQYDGITFKEPFLGGNGAGGANGNVFAGVADVQVVAGAGDATQGGVGSGVINVIPQRGSGPGTLDLDLEAGAPNFSHQIGASWSYASPDGRFSDFIAFTGQRFVPYNGYHTTPLDQYGNFFSTSFSATNQFLNNFVFKFGHQQNQSLQVLYYNVLQEAWGAAGPGGIYCDPAAPNTPGGGPCPANTNPNALVYYPYDTLTQSTFENFLGYSQQQYQKLIGLSPGVPTQNVAVPGPQLDSVTSTRLLKLEYDYHINPSTYMDLRYYNWAQTSTTDSSYQIGAWGTGFPGAIQAWNSIGGPTIGASGDLTHQFSPQLTVSLNAKYEVLEPMWDGYAPAYTNFGLFGTGLLNQPAPADWLPGGYLCGGNKSKTDYFNCAAPGSVSNTRIPSGITGYNGSFFQNWGAGIRFQYSPSDRVHLDLGVRQEGQNQHWFDQLQQYGQGPPPGINPFDVLPSTWNTAVLYPHVTEPRTSIAWQLDRDDALRFSYGRSAVFANAQTAGVPFHAYGLTPYLNIPAKPGSTCGWTSTKTFPCPSYGAQLYWEGDNIDAPDAGNTQPALYTNFDFSYSHLFKNGYGLRITPFSKIGSSLPTYYLLNPVLNIFATNNLGYNKTNGVEFQVTTPQHLLGFSGFISATYQNVLSTTPPFTAAETQVPLVSDATLALGDLYRAGYVSPFSVRIGGTDNLKNGFSVNPQVQFNIGYPFSVGNIIAGQLGPGVYANVQQINFGPGVGSGTTTLLGTNPGTTTSTNFYDPSFPGSTQRPNIDATRGVPQTAANGGYLSHVNVFGSTTFAWKHLGSTIGLQVQNLFGNAYVNSVPTVNPYYQAVANGVSGPQTGYNTCVAQVGSARGCTAFIPRDTYAYTNGAYLLSNGNFTGAPALAPLVPFNITLFFQQKL